MGIFITWIILTVLVGIMGTDRRIGGAAAFFLSLFLSPLVGFIFTVISDKLSDLEYKQALYNVQKQTLENTKKDSSGIASELEKLIKMKANSQITEEEFNVLKEKLLK